MQNPREIKGAHELVGARWDQRSLIDDPNYMYLHHDAGKILY